MAIKPREIVKEKKQFFHRDDVLIVIAFAVAGGMYWAAMSGDYPKLALVLEYLSYVLGGIGVVMILSMLIASSKKRAAQRQRPRR